MGSPLPVSFVFVFVFVSLISIICAQRPLSTTTTAPVGITTTTALPAVQMKYPDSLFRKYTVAGTDINIKGNLYGINVKYLQEKILEKIEEMKAKERAKTTTTAIPNPSG